MIKFLKKNWTLILVILYIISPDLILGPLDDAALLVAERLTTSLINRKRAKKDEEQNNKEKS